MDYRLRYTQKALNDLDEIIGRIAEDDAEAASRFGGSLLDHTELLARFPRMGALIRRRRNVRKLERVNTTSTAPPCGVNPEPHARPLTRLKNAEFRDDAFQKAAADSRFYGDKCSHALAGC